MITITFKIKLMNRVKPVGLDNYKKRAKLPRQLRSMSSDDLNQFEKEVQIMDHHYARNAWGKEISELINKTPWKIETQPDFGDTLIGYVCIEEYPDFYREIFKGKKEKSIF